MIPHIKKFFIIIVHHGEASPTNRLLESISGSRSAPDQIFLVDHAEASYQVPKLTVPVTLIRPQHNDGYAAGINVGLGAIYSSGAKSADIILCANNDISLDTQALEKIRAWWANHGEGHILGARFGLVNLFTGRSRLTPVLAGRQKRPWELVYIDGALFSLSLGTFFDLSGMDSSYTLYWEDAAFSRKAAQRGTTLHALNLSLKHPSDKLHSPSDTKLYYLVRNGAHFLAHETALPWRLFWQLKNRLRLMYHRLSQSSPVIQEALADAIKNQLGPRI